MSSSDEVRTTAFGENLATAADLIARLQATLAARQAAQGQPEAAPVAPPVAPVAPRPLWRRQLAPQRYRLINRTIESCYHTLAARGVW